MAKVRDMTIAEIKAINEQIEKGVVSLNGEAGKMIAAVEGERIIAAIDKGLEVGKEEGCTPEELGVLEEMRCSIINAVAKCKGVEAASPQDIAKAMGYIIGFKSVIAVFPDTISGKKGTIHPERRTKVKFGEQKKGINEVGLDIAERTRKGKKAEITYIQRDLADVIMNGLLGLTPYQKVFIICLAQALSDQSKTMGTESSLTGARDFVEKEYRGEIEKVSKWKNCLPLPTKEGTIEERPYPFVFVTYEQMAGLMRGEGRQRGGKDAQKMKDAFMELGQKYFDMDYTANGEDYGIKMPLFNIPLQLTKNGKDVGCGLFLTPLFSATSKRLRYLSARGDLVQKLGGGDQSEMTTNLLFKLLYNRGIKGDKFQKGKTELLGELSKGKTDTTRPRIREMRFKEAVAKMKDIGLISSYREPKNSRGEKMSVFIYNKDYLKELEEPEEAQ